MSLTLISKVLLLIASFLLGFGLVKFSLIPTLLAFSILLYRKNLTFRFGRLIYIVNIIVVLLFFLTMILIGYGQFNINNPIQQLCVGFYTFIFLYFFIINEEDSKLKLYYFMCYILGIAIRQSIITIYSLMHGGAYGDFYDPVTAININSPAVANLLLASFCFFVCFHKLFKNKYIVLLLPLLIFFIGVSTGSRTFVLVSLLSASYMFFIAFFSLKQLLKFFILIIPLSFSIAYYLYVGYLVNLPVFERFSEVGMKSARFELYADGMSKLVSYPLGGFDVSKSIDGYSGVWFHNVILDIAAIGGLIPLFFFCIAMSLNLYIIISKVDLFLKHRVFVFFTILVLIMMQDVIIEGNMNILVMALLAPFSFINNGNSYGK